MLGIGELFSISCALAWAIAVIFMKKAGESLAPIPLNLFKNVLALALFAVTLAVAGGASDLPPEALWLALVSGFLGIGVGDTLFFKALNRIGASRMGLAQTLYSPSVIVLSALFLGERLAPLQFAGVALVLAGILLVTYMKPITSLDASRWRSGFFWGGLSVSVMGAGVVIAKPLLESYDFLWVVTLRIVGGLAGLLVFVAWRMPMAELVSAYRNVRHWPAVVASTVIGSYLSMMLWLAGYKYTSASVAAVLNETAAVFILVLSVLFLRERITPRQFAGTALALAGVAIVVAF